MASQTLISGGKAVAAAASSAQPRAGLWLTIAELARGLDIAQQGVRANIERHLGDGDIWYARPKRIRLGAVIALLEARASARVQDRARAGASAPLGPNDVAPTLALAGGGATPPVGPSPDADLEGGPPTEALERMRMLRGDLLELQLQRERGALLSRTEVQDSLGAFFQTLRGMADTLSRSHPGAAEIVVDALRELTGAADSAGFKLEGT